MTTKPKTPATEVEQVIEAAGVVSGPVVQRLGSHRDRFDLAIKQLEAERFELVSQKDAMKRAYEAAEQGLNHHIQDIENCLSLYERGLNGLPADGSKTIE